MGQKVGLDYTVLLGLIGLYGYGSDVFEQVRYLELGALTAYSGKELEIILDG